MNTYGLNWWNRFGQTQTELASSRLSWNRHIRNIPKMEPILTLGTSGTWFKSNVRGHNHSSPSVMNLVVRIVIHEVPGGSSKSWFGHLVFVNHHNAGYELKLSCLTCWTKKLPELEYKSISNMYFTHCEPPGVWENMECNPSCVNFRRVSYPRRAFRPAFRVTGISDNSYWSTMGVIVTSMGTPMSARENYGGTWKYLEAAATSLAALTTRLGAPARCLGAPQLTIEQSGKKIFFRNSCWCAWISYLLHIVPWFWTLIYSVWNLIYISMYRCIYIAAHLYTVYLDWLQVVLESNVRYAWKWRSSELRDTLHGRDQLSLGMHLVSVIKCIWRYCWRWSESNVEDALWDRYRASFEILFETMSMRTWRPWSSKWGDSLEPCDWVSLEICTLESMMVRTWRP